MDYWYSHEVSQMDLILSLKLVRDDALRMGIGIIDIATHKISIF